jgi:uncharacterized protein YukE
LFLTTKPSGTTTTTFNDQQLERAVRLRAGILPIIPYPGRCECNTLLDPHTNTTHLAHCEAGRFRTQRHNAVKHLIHHLLTQLKLSVTEEMPIANANGTHTSYFDIAFHHNNKLHLYDIGITTSTAASYSEQNTNDIMNNLARRKLTKYEAILREVDPSIQLVGQSWVGNTTTFHPIIWDLWGATSEEARSFITFLSTQIHHTQPSYKHTNTIPTQISCLLQKAAAANTFNAWNRAMRRHGPAIHNITPQLYTHHHRINTLQLPPTATTEELLNEIQPPSPTPSESTEVDPTPPSTQTHNPPPTPELTNTNTTTPELPTQHPATIQNEGIPDGKGKFIAREIIEEKKENGISKFLVTWVNSEERTWESYQNISGTPLLAEWRTLNPVRRGRRPKQI